jgi:hypothetical protein
MASTGYRTRSRRASCGQAQRLAADSSDIGQLLPWWSKLVHQMLLADETTARGGNEDSHDREDRCVASGAPRVRVRAAIDGSTGVRARRID